MSAEPSLFGRYALMKRIAIGGMAEVFRAVARGAEGFEKLVAIKRMLPHLSDDAQFVDMFINEAKVAAYVNHANIVQIYDFGAIENLLFLSMEYVRGKNISEIVQALKNRGLTAPIELVCFVFIEVLNGLNHAHRQRDRSGRPLVLVHRDVSPPNIMVSFAGEVKITDFGIAKATRSRDPTVSGVLKGKYAYMSPEQAQGKPVDLRTDIFSAGITMYELLTLEEMVTGVSDMEVLRKIRDAEYIRPRLHNPEIPQELEDILVKALQKDPADRYTSAAEWREALESFFAHSNLRYSTSWLAQFMQEIFRDEIEAEQKEMIAEAEIASKLHAALPAKSLDDPLIDFKTFVTDRPAAIRELSKALGDLQLGDRDKSASTVRLEGPEAAQVRKLAVETATPNPDSATVDERHPAPFLRRETPKPGADSDLLLPPTQPGQLEESITTQARMSEAVATSRRPSPWLVLIACLVGMALGVGFTTLFFLSRAPESCVDGSPEPGPSPDAGLPATSSPDGQDGGVPDIPPVVVQPDGGATATERVVKRPHRKKGRRKKRR